jgi:hypothetical protein
MKTDAKSNKNTAKYGNKSKPLVAVVLFFSWLKTWIWFYIFKCFRMWNYEQIEFLEKSYFPQNKRDEKLMNKILEFNRSRLKNIGESLDEVPKKI